MKATEPSTPDHETWSEVAAGAIDSETAETIAALRDAHARRHGDMEADTAAPRLQATAQQGAQREQTRDRTSRPRRT